MPVTCARIMLFSTGRSTVMSDAFSSEIVIPYSYRYMVYFLPRNSRRRYHPSRAYLATGTELHLQTARNGF